MNSHNPFQQFIENSLDLGTLSGAPEKKEINCKTVHREIDAVLDDMVDTVDKPDTLRMQFAACLTAEILATYLNAGMLTPVEGDPGEIDPENPEFFVDLSDLEMMIKSTIVLVAQAYPLFLARWNDERGE